LQNGKLANGDAEFSFRWEINMRTSDAAWANSGAITAVGERRAPAGAVAFPGGAAIETRRIAAPRADCVSEDMGGADGAVLTEFDLVSLAKSGHRSAFRIITQRCNQRLFRIARSVLHDESEAEEALQEAYISAFRKINSFRGDSSLFTWLTRITLNEARGRLRRKKQTVSLDGFGTIERDHTLRMCGSGPEANPEAETARSEVRSLIEKAIDGLPEMFRVVFVMRDVEECTAEETAVALHLRQPTVNTRLHRARKLLRAALSDDLSPRGLKPFPFSARAAEGSRLR
jgi:RNA polymerase sigma-70 factor, ECF subfamily